MTPRQRTIRRPAAVTGYGFFTNADVTVCFLPAPPDAGIAFFRTDLPGRPAIPATIDHAVERHRRTALEHDGASVELTEHLLAALAGLQIDNCRVEIDGPEPPGGDGSAKHFIDAILEAGIVEQDRPAHVYAVTEPLEIRLPDGSGGVKAEPADDFVLRYDLDYGTGSPISVQSAEFGIDPDVFAGEIAGARTFILETEIAALKGRGYGKHVTSSDLLVFGETGVIGNRLRADNECARHKLLDCVGDFALIGGRLAGRFVASKTGHAANRELIRRLVAERRVAGRRAA